MNKTFAKIMAAGTLAAMLTTAMPMTSIAAEAATVSTTAKQSQAKKMYVTKTCYSYKSNSTKSAKVKKLSKGAAISVVSEKKSFYKLADGSYVLKSRVGEKRINWTVTKYKTPLTRYVLKDNTKVRSSALSNGKIVDFASKGVKLTIVGKTNSGFYLLDDGNYIKTSSVTKTKPVSSDNYYDDFEDKSDFNLYVTLLGNVGVSNAQNAVITPGDLQFSLTTSGESYEGFVSAVNGDTFTVSFENIGLTAKQLANAKISFPNSFYARFIEGDVWQPTFADSGTNVLTLKPDRITEELQNIYVPIEDIPQALLDKLQSADAITVDADSLSSEVSIPEGTMMLPRALCEDYGISVDLAKNYAYSATLLPDKDTAICSGTIMDINAMALAEDSDLVILDNREAYLNSEWARQIADIFVYCDGELVCHTYPDSDGIFYYTIPITMTDNTYTDSEPTGDITFGFLGFDKSMGDIRQFTGITQPEFQYYYPSSADNFLLALCRDFEVTYQN